MENKREDYICEFREGFAYFIKFTKQDLAFIHYWGACLGYEWIENDPEYIAVIKGFSLQDERRFGELRKIRREENGVELILYGWTKKSGKFMIKYPIDRNLTAHKLYEAMKATSQVENCKKIVGISSDDLDMERRLPDFEEDEFKVKIKKHYNPDYEPKPKRQGVLV